MPAAAPPQRPARVTAPIANWPPSTNLQEAVGGELSTRTPPPIEQPAPSVPSMIIKDASVPMAMPGSGDHRGNGFGLPGGAVVLALDGYVPEGDGSTDLLHAYRRRSLIRIVILGAVLAALAAIGLLWRSSGSPRPPKQPQVMKPSAVIDAGPREEDPPPQQPDAGLTREEIERLSRTGHYSLQSTLPATVFINEVKVGETPLVNYQLPPGKHKVRVVSEKGTKRFDIVVLGGQRSNGGELTW
jgi:hypothetical protein